MAACQRRARHLFCTWVCRAPTRLVVAAVPVPAQAETETKARLPPTALYAAQQAGPTDLDRWMGAGGIPTASECWPPKTQAIQRAADMSDEPRWPGLMVRKNRVSACASDYARR
ncbi:hypothetical protein BS50DRAFT_574395 [Corynespora cassiicola Philippines]|uniref:Secreted protein n=1 Tax=Corynespora cassiicola Philippines TaxID=1448308 RepID=A0A2T2NKE4_CORCC|nr:hypothetical protein BS50DRAFT_574395 [Corynespora cassiicola Philippines]